MFSESKVHEKTGRGRGFYQEYRDDYGQFMGNEKISRETFIALGGTPRDQMPKPQQVVSRQVAIGKKWIFLSGSLAGGYLTLLLTAIL